MRVTIPDEMAEALTEYIHGRRTLEQEIQVRLQESLAAGPGESRLVLGSDRLVELGEALGTELPIRTPERLLTLCTRLAQLHLGEVRLTWTPEQLALLTARAERSGLSVPQFVAGIASRLLSEVFLVEPPKDIQAICIERLVVPVEPTTRDQRVRQPPKPVQSQARVPA